MKGHCSLNDNYEIINICNISEFNNKINQFSDKSWTEISISEKLKIPSNYLPIKSVSKIYLNIKITSTKLVEPPFTDTPNIEGITISGKLLLVFGEIFQTIVYVSETNTNLMNSVNFKNFFNTYIVVDKNINFNNNTYSIHPYIENIFIKPLSEKVLINNIHLFVFAHQLLSNIKKLPNKITVRTNTNEEVLSIEFDSNKQKFIVNSTEKIPNPSSTDAYFTLILKNKSANKDLLNITLYSNENGENFKNHLNDKDFQYNDNRLILIFKYESKVEISNYPFYGNTYIPNLNSDIFQITDNGLISKSFPNKIIIFNDTNDKVSNLQFINTENNPVLISTSTGAIGTNSLENNIKYVQLLNYSNSQVQFNGEILGKQNATQFISSLNDKIVGINLPIRLFNRIPNRIIITNYNEKNEYIIGEEPEFFTATNNILVKYYLNYNKIKIKNLDDSSILFIYFNKIDANTIYIEPYATGVLNNSLDYFSFKIQDPDETTIKVQGNMNKGETGDLLVNSVGISPSNISKNFNFGDILELNSSNPVLVEIFDVSAKKIISNLNANSEKFEITEAGLALANLSKLSITFKGINEKTIATLKFDVINQILIVTSTNEQANPLFSNEEYFAVIFEDNIKNIKKEAIVKGNDTANDFKNILNNTSFNYNSMLVIRSKEATKIFISNYPTLSQNSNPFLSKDIFKISKLGLVPFYNYLNNIITFKNVNDNIALQLRFNENLKELSVGDNSSIINPTIGNTEYFAIILNNFNGMLKEEISIKGNYKGSFVTNILNGKSFDYNDIITLRYKENNKILISNYPNDGNTFNPPNNKSSFLINQNGLNRITFFFNSIYVENTENLKFVEINFVGLNTLFILNGGVKANPSSGSNEYFTFILMDSNSKIKYEASVNENEDASSLLTNLGGRKFEYNDIINLKYKDNNSVFLLNYPISGEMYTPSKFNEKFIFNNNRIEPLIPPKPIIKLQSYFSFKTFDTKKELVKVEFDIANKKLIVTSTNLSYNNPAIATAFKFELLSLDEITVKNFATINGDEDATKFKNTLNGRIFDFDYLIRLQFDNSADVVLVNYPILGDNYRMQTSNEQTFKITQNGVIPYVLSNTIALNDTTDNPILTIEFDVLSKRILVNSTGNISNPGNTDYFVVTLYGLDGKTQKQTGNVIGGQNADYFKTIYSNTEYEFGDIIELKYEERNAVDITNFIYSHTFHYNPFGVSEKYIITKNGLNVLTLSTYFSFKTYDTNEEMATVKFDKLNKILRINSTGKNCNYLDNSIVFGFFLSEATPPTSIEKIKYYFYGKNNADHFRNRFNGFKFSYIDNVGVSIDIGGPKVLLINFPTIGSSLDIAAKGGVFKSFVITPNGITE